MAEKDGPKEGDPDASSEGKPPKRKRAKRNPLRAARRVTLSFAGPPLAMPGQSDPTDKPATSEAPASPADAGAVTTNDAWTRDRIERSSDIKDLLSPPPPAETPPMIPPHPSAVPSSTGALDLVDRRRRSSPALDLSAEMEECYALGDFTNALRIAELLLGRSPDHTQAQRTARMSRERLEQHYSSQLGSVHRIPIVAVLESEVRWLGLDHRAGFLLSRIDGQHTIEELVEISNMPRLEVFKTLHMLLEAGTIRYD